MGGSAGEEEGGLEDLGSWFVTKLRVPLVVVLPQSTVENTQGDAVRRSESSTGLHVRPPETVGEIRWPLAAQRPQHPPIKDGVRGLVREMENGRSSAPAH